VKRFLEVAKASGAQVAALYSLAIDSGMRKAELFGLRWEDVDFAACRVRVLQQLMTPKLGEDGQPVFGPTKTGKVRSITLSADTVELLRAHRRTQREHSMAHRTTYRDFGLVFAREDGSPVLMNNIGQREYAQLVKASGVKAIKFHGMRHTCATLLLRARVPVHVVSERLGHSKVSMTMETYAHVLPDMQQSAADALGAVLHGRS
jgi:integrase